VFLTVLESSNGGFRMDEKRLLELLQGVRSGALEINQALNQLRSLPYEQVGDFAVIDHHRALRCGFPEVVYGQSKTPEQIQQIVMRLAAVNDRVLVTRATTEAYAAVEAVLPDAVYHARARLITYEREPWADPLPGVVVATGGTTDLPVAEEAAITAELMGNQVVRLYDVGVAGLHRLLDRTEALQKARVIVAAAGMEGALASVIGGLVSVPVIAVPTSVGYGASFNGLAALLAMLNSCATGVAVVNIDNGFGAGYMAGMINRQRSDESPSPKGKEAGHVRAAG
jgi:pyridinium-3,5-biscarboxylic acid mononucleotide synthase